MVYGNCCSASFFRIPNSDFGKFCFLPFGDRALNDLRHSVQGRVIETGDED